MEKLINEMQNFLRDFPADREVQLGVMRELTNEMVDINYDWQSKEMECNEFEFGLNGKWNRYILSMKNVLEPNQNDNESIKAMKFMILHNEVPEVIDMIEFISPKLAEYNLYDRKSQEAMKFMLEKIVEMEELLSVKMQCQAHQQIHSHMPTIASDMTVIAKQIEVVETNLKKIYYWIGFRMSEAMTKLKTKLDLLNIEVLSWEKVMADFTNLKVDS